MKKAIEKMVSLDSYITSKEGYPIFDLMEAFNASNGYGDKLPRWRASNIVFYTEYEILITEVNKLRKEGDLDAIKEFLTTHKEFIRPLYSDKHTKIEEMSESAILAFNHLSSSEQLKETLSKGYYGIAHLIENGELLIFNQNKQVINEVFKKNLNIMSNYRDASNLLRKMFNDKKIEPDAAIEGNAFNKVMEVLLPINFNQMNKYQKDTLLLLTEFENITNGDLTMSTKSVGNTHQVIFQFGKDKIEVNLPETKKEHFNVVKNDNKEEDSQFTMKLDQMLYYVNKECAASKVSKFIKKMKV